MTHSPIWRARRLQAIALALLLTILWGCGSGPEPKTEDLPPPKVEPVVPPGISLQLPPSEFNSEFASAGSDLEQGDWMAAEVALQDIPRQALSLDDRTYLEYLEARIAWARGRRASALATLERLDYPGMNPGLQYRTLNLRRRILALSGDSLASAQLGDRALALAPADEAAVVRREIWRNLQRLAREDLNAALSVATDSQWQGWLQLALASRGDTSRVSAAVTGWRDTNATHPAARDLPGGLGYQLDADQAPARVALMLPLSGRLAPAGKAVRDGYMASYYAARVRGETDLELLILDVDGYESALAAYDDALAQGAALVIGPLSKQAVTDLGARPERPIPVLALNRVEQLLPASGSPLVQLSLAAEDEASRIAELAFGQGARSALILRPAGNWGSRMENALRNRWQELGGVIADSASYSNRDDYSPSVQAALDLDASQKRAGEIRAMLATSVEFTPRRRQDVDAIFLLSRHGPEARSIKPLLAFHYAASIPVYAPSSVYSGIPDSRDRDLDGIKLVETPWLLGANPGLRVAIAAGDTGSDNYTRLNALGADAFLLQSSFARVQAGPDLLLRGNTGLLSMNPQLQLQRELSLATFDGGVLQAR